MCDSADTTDGGLLQRFGDAEHRDCCAVMLVRRFNPLVRGILCKEVRKEQDAEDLEQDFWIHLQKQARRFEPRRAGSAKAWIGTVLRNFIISKGRAARLPVAAADWEGLPAPSNGSLVVPEDPESEELLVLADATLKGLDWPTQACFLLARSGGGLGEMIQEDVADLLGVSTPTVNRRIATVCDALEKLDH